MDCRIQYKMKSCKDKNVCMENKLKDIEIENRSLTIRFQNLMTNHSELMTYNNELNTSHSKLMTDFNKLNNSYNELMTNHSKVMTTYNELNTNYNELMTSHSKLMTNYNELNTNYSKFMINYNEVSTNYTALDDKVKKFAKDVRDGIISLHPSGWNYTSFRKSVYHFSTDSTNWADANITCASISCCSLVIVDDSAEQEFIKNYDKEKRWIGLQKDGAGNDFQWVDGTSLATAFWASDEPNNENTEFCVTKGAEFDQDKWNNDMCNAFHRRICEFKPECYVRSINKKTISVSQTK
ncbi:C-type lectin domain family 4 member M isoform X2 [Callorhinchus milii]|uniref:C-type lectin domain family 4 member M isoform X2 n=1 Tax=Callorhinchus milii TaxID=7868 RepID=UPI00045756DC|nr:C-type lectin domain family 4 member M isoform X2 [Callorhinchus milii]|eukprot:gi/632964850/ref/XP_007898599.1/ PREDICTED: C-type lectin domain family 4 member G-like [Callorhinchus milii]